MSAIKLVLIACYAFSLVTSLGFLGSCGADPCDCEFTVPGSEQKLSFKCKKDEICGYLPNKTPQCLAKKIQERQRCEDPKGCHCGVVLTKPSQEGALCHELQSCMVVQSKITCIPEISNKGKCSVAGCLCKNPGPGQVSKICLLDQICFTASDKNPNCYTKLLGKNEVCPKGENCLCQFGDAEKNAVFCGGEETCEENTNKMPSCKKKRRLSLNNFEDRSRLDFMTTVSFSQGNEQGSRADLKVI